MRMRRKKNLESRLLECKEYLIDCVNEDLNFQNAEKADSLLDFKEIFKNSNPVVLEIGCGKGAFACTYAQTHPEINVLAVERVANVIVTACETAEKAEIGNIKFMKCNAEYLPSYIPKNSISQIFLNFSCPFPKAKYAKH
ncbi:MAG: methyltransferase domain-containing protein, partial [Clostridiales bacterium]|nr:methyltransferase domain-containing protein [Clostridiales bacterium]